MAEREEALLKSRREKLDRLRASGTDPYPARFRRSHDIGKATALFNQREGLPKAQAPEEPLSLAGRIVAMRRMGKATFLDLRDGSGKVQVHLRRDLLGDRYNLVREMDLGDFLGAQGTLFRTDTGEITLQAVDITVLAKSLRPLPEKWHGLADAEKRYRHRYLDLIANQEVRETFSLRSRLIAGVRRFLDSRGFIEVETPILLPVAAGALARPFATRHHALDRELFLRIATELHLKRLIIGGFDRVYEIGRVFRNEGIDTQHNPEFTTLESYEAYADYNDVMAMAESMVASAASDLLGGTKVHWGDQTIDFSPPWQRVKLRDAIKERAGLDIEECPNVQSLKARMAAMKVQAEERASWGRLVDKLLSTCVEPGLVQPTFLLDYPVEMSPLAKRKPDDPRYVERFEAFAGGMEIANAFTELNDPVDQRERLLQQEALRRELGEEEVERLDEDFLFALEHGMPPTGGLGVGLDRLAMLFTGKQSIREVILFPQMREK